jgi:hypothetical protein
MDIGDQMKNHLYFVIAAGLLLVFAYPAGVAAQSAGNSPPVAQPSPRKVSLKAIEKAINNSMRDLEASDGRIKEQIKILGERSVSDIAFEDVFRMLHLQKAELTIEVEGLNARLELLKSEAEKVTSGETETEYSKIQREAAEKQLALTKKQFETTKKLAEKGALSSNELASSRYEMEVAHLRLSANRAKARQGSPKLVEEILKTSLEIAEKKARQKTVLSMLQNYEDSRSGFSKLESLKRTRNSLESRREELIREMWKIGVQGTDF